MYTKTKIKKKLAVFLCLAVTISTIITNTGVVSATGMNMQTTAQKTDISVISDDLSEEENEPWMVSNEADIEAETSPQAAEENTTDTQAEDKTEASLDVNKESESSPDISDEEINASQEDGQTDADRSTEVGTKASTDNESTESISSEAASSVEETTQEATQPVTQKPTEQASTEQASTEQPSTEQPTTDAALALLLLKAANKVTFAYNSYPYGLISGSNITLTTALSKGTAVTVQWYRADSKNGSYTEIDGATELTYTFSAVSGTTYWYKCNVNGYDTYPVQVIHASDSSSDSIYVHDRGTPVSAWYISNGTMAYTNGISGGSYPAFDVIGTYLYNGISSTTNQTYVGQTLWISTSYSGGWKMNSDVDYIICTFDPNDAHSVKCKAVLKEGKSTFGLYADVCLGSSSLFSSLADNASLKTILEEVNGTKKASQVQMVGAATVDDAVVTDPAFVLGCIDRPSTFFVGGYSESKYQYTSYNTSVTGSGVKAHEVIDGTDVVTEVAGIDSGFAIGWQNISKGYVDFTFNIGSVEQTGAQITANSKVTSKTITITQEEGEIGSYRYRLYDKEAGIYTEWKIPDSETRECVFDNLTPNHTYEIFMEEIATGKTDSMGDTTTAIDPVNPGAGSGEDTPAVETAITYNTIAFKHLNADYQYRLLDEDENPVSNWYAVSGDNNEVTFTDLTPGTDYYLVARTDDNSQTDKIPYTTDKVTISYADNVDGEEIEVPSSHEYSYGDVLSTMIPVRTGYDFLGWNYEENKDSDEAEFLIGESTDIEEPVTLYACWKIKTYTVDIADTQQYTVEKAAYAEHGSNYVIILSPAAGYILSNVKASVNNGEYTSSNVTYDEASGKYKITISNVTENKTVSVSCDYTTLLAIAQESARQEISDAKAQADAKIDALDKLSDSKKIYYKELIEAQKNTVLGAIDAATDPADVLPVENALSYGKTSIEQIVNQAVAEALSEAKAKAYADLTEKANAAIRQIEELTDLTENEAQDAIAEINRQLSEAQNRIDNIADYDDISAVNDIVAGFDDTLTEDITEAKETDLSNAKVKAETAIDDMISEAEQIIDGLTDLTASEKAAAKKAVSDSAKAAKADIAKITDHDKKSDIPSIVLKEENKVESEKTEAKKTDLSNAKTKAEATIDKLAADAIDRIDTLTDLSDDEKAAAKKDISDKAEAAKADIEKVTDPDNKLDIEVLKITGTENIGASEETAKELDLSNAREAAIAQIEAARKSASDAVDALTDLSESEKAAKKQAVNKWADEANAQIENISNPSDKSSIKELITSGKENIGNEEKAAKNLDLSNAKEKAVSEIEEAVKASIDKIDELTDLTDAQKALAKKEVQDRSQKACDNINNITSFEDKADISSNVTSAIEDIAVSTDNAEKLDLSNAKDKAKASIDEALNKTYEAIDALEDLSNIEKTAAKKKTAAKADDIKNVIDGIANPEDKADIALKVSEAEDVIANEETKAVKLDLSNARESGKNEIDKAAQNIINELKRLTDLTEDELNAAIEKIDYIALGYKDKIDDITNPQEKGTIAEIVAAAKSEMNIEKEEAKASDLSNAKATAIKKVNEKAEESKAIINSLTDITDEQKAEAVEKIDRIADNAQSAIEDIDNPSDKALVAESEKEYISGIEAVEETSKNNDIVNAKEKAYAEIDKAAEKAKEEAGSLSDLTDEQLNAVYEEIARKAETAKEAIDSVTEHENKSQIEAEKNTGVAAIENTGISAKNLDLSNAKDKAKNEIDKKADEAKNTIDVLDDLTDEEKQDAKTEIDKKAEEAKASINEITDPENKSEVTSNKEIAAADIESKKKESKELDLSNAKDNAKAEIDKKADEAKNAIDALDDLTDEEKQDAKTEIDKKAEEAKASINEVTDPENKSEVTSNKDIVAADIENRKAESAEIDLDRAKDNAKIEIDKKADEAKKAIDVLDDLTDEEKQDAKSEVDKKADEAKASINEVTDPENKSEVTSNKDIATADIKNKKAESEELDLSNAKDKAKDEIDKKADEAKNAIDVLDDLTDEEKQDAKAEIDRKAAQAKAEVDGVISRADKDNIKTIGISAEEDITIEQKKAEETDFVNAKENAKEEIDKKAEEAKAEIDAMPGFTNVEKTAAKNEIDANAQKAKDEIEGLNSPSEKSTLINKKKDITSSIIEKENEMVKISKEREDDDDDTTAPSKGTETPSSSDINNNEAESNGNGTGTSDGTSVSDSETAGTGNNANAGTAADTSDNAATGIWLLLMISSMMLIIAETIRKKQTSK